MVFKQLMGPILLPRLPAPLLQFQEINTGLLILAQLDMATVTLNSALMVKVNFLLVQHLGLNHGLDQFVC